MRELAQLLWWQRLKWRQQQQRWWLQQLQARGLNSGAAGRLGCTVLSPARGPGCWGACKNLRGARDGLRKGQGSGVRGSGVRVRGYRWVPECGQRGQGGPKGTAGKSPRASLPVVQAGTLHPLSSSSALWGDPLSEAQPWIGRTWSWNCTPLPSPLLPHLLFALEPSGDSTCTAKLLEQTA